MNKSVINNNLQHNQDLDSLVDNNYQPLELELQTKGLKKIVRSDGKINDSESKLIEKSHEVEKKGLINMLKSSEFQLENEQVQVMVCITMYNEPLTQLIASVNGVVNNLIEFSKMYLYFFFIFSSGRGRSNQIGICVFFDGIDQIKNSIQLKDSEHDIIPYFNHLDDNFKIKADQTLSFHYKKYKEMKQASLFYHPNQLKKLKESNTVLQQYISDKKEKKKIDKMIEEEKQKLMIDYVDEDLENFVEDLDKKNELILGVMKKIYDEAKYYLESRCKTAWVYQIYNQIKISSVKRYDSDKTEIVNVPIFFVFKHANGKKLSSHLWFFKGFCEEIKPKYCLLMDGGAVPDQDSIFKLYMTMETQENLGGACGYMSVMQEKMQEELEPMDSLSHFLNKHVFDIQKCQLLEYHCGHILDKSFEGALGFIHVLPGAFSIYRWTALDQKDEKSDKGYVTLDIYLSQVLDPNHTFKDLDEANMFLAEDRVLCLYIYCFKNKKFTLGYVPDAYVSVDAPKTLLQLMLQRRRWINGSWFALNHVKALYKNFIGQSGHGYGQIPFRYSINQALLGQCN